MIQSKFTLNSLLDDVLSTQKVEISNSEISFLLDVSIPIITE